MLKRFTQESIEYNLSRNIEENYTKPHVETNHCEISVGVGNTYS